MSRLRMLCLQGAWCWMAVLSMHADAQSIHPSSQTVNIGSDEVYQEAIQALSQGQTRRAQALLQEVVRHIPEHAGAWLDLALLHCQLGNAAQAEEIFQKVERELRAPESILALIQKTREQGCRAPRTWIQQANLSVGRASNVNYAPTAGVIQFASSAPFSQLTLSPSYRPKADQFLSSELVWFLPANQENWAGAQWQTLLQYKKYQSASQYDSLVVAGNATWRGLMRDMKDFEWLPSVTRLFESWEVNAIASHWHMGSAAYETSGQLWLGTWSQEQNNWWGTGSDWRWGIDTGLSHYIYAQNSSYNALRWDGKLRSQWRFKWAGLAHTATASLGLVIDQPMGERPGGYRLGNTAQAQLETQWTEKENTVAYLQQQYLPEIKPYNEAFFAGTKRAPISWMAGVRYQHRLGPQHQFFAQASYQRVIDRINLFTYTNQMLSLGYQWQF